MSENIIENQNLGENPQYCHYFTNYGKCFFEEKTGNRCRFEHKTAPMCQRGAACNRTKCMFTHPNLEGRNYHFLGRSGSMNNVNPWGQQQMMSPFMNPWGMMNMNPFQQQTTIKHTKPMKKKTRRGGGQNQIKGKRQYTLHCLVTTQME